MRYQYTTRNGYGRRFVVLDGDRVICTVETSMDDDFQQAAQDANDIADALERYKGDHHATRNAKQV